MNFIKKSFSEYAFQSFKEFKILFLSKIIEKEKTFQNVNSIYIRLDLIKNDIKEKVYLFFKKNIKGKEFSNFIEKSFENRHTKLNGNIKKNNLNLNKIIFKPEIKERKLFLRKLENQIAIITVK